jgi:prolyl oligopeptidase
LNFDARSYLTRQVFVPSKDGTESFVLIIDATGLGWEPSNPALRVWRFNILLVPVSTPPPWPGWRWRILAGPPGGGGEYGEAWHQAGMLHEKQNVFDDFIA